jgi:hypothetical protein
MIATTQTPLPKPAQPAPAVPDPRRSYDRGAWVGAVANETTTENRMTETIDLSKLSLADLRRELDRRERERQGLVAKRDKLAAELADLDAQILRLEGNGGAAADRAERPARQRAPKLALPRPKNSLSLPDAIALEAEPGQVVSPAEIAKRVLASGYQTNASKFAMVVANALNKHKGFRRIGRGRYERVI